MLNINLNHGASSFEYLCSFQVNPVKNSNEHDEQGNEKVDPLEGGNECHTKDHQTVDDVEDYKSICGPDVLKQSRTNARHLEDAHDCRGNEKTGDHF